MSAQVFEFSHYTCAQSVDAQLTRRQAQGTPLSLGSAHESPILKVYYSDSLGQSQQISICSSGSLMLNTDDPVAEQMFIDHLQGMLALMGGRLEGILRVSSLALEVNSYCTGALNDRRDVGSELAIA